MLSHRREEWSEAKSVFNEKGTNCMGEHICQWYIGQGFNLQNISRTHTTQHQENKQSNEKMSKRSE